MIAESQGLDWTIVGVMTPILIALLTFASLWGRKAGESAGLQQAIGFQRELTDVKLASVSSAVGRVADDVKEVRREQARAEKSATEHRHDDNDQFHEIALWKEWIEGVLTSHGMITNVRDTGPHKPTPRSRTPAPSSEDSR